jgi:HEAT repeat protein
MRHVSDPVLRLSHALRRVDTAAAAVEALRGHEHPAAVEGLLELLDNPPSPRAALAALRALDERDGPLVVDALRQALGSAYAQVRVAAVEAVQRRGAPLAAEAVLRLLRTDPSWPVRRAAVRALGDVGAAQRWGVLSADDDPHWRVRHALAGVLLRWDAVEREEVEFRLALLPAGTRVEGLRAYLAHRTGRPVPAEPGLARPPAPPFWDEDVAVLVRNLEQLGPAGRRAHLDAMPALLAHADERVVRLAQDALRRDGQPAHLALALEHLDEPRHGAGAALAELLRGLDLDRTEALAAHVLATEFPGPAALAWAIDQVAEALEPEDIAAVLARLLATAADQPAVVRRALARLLGRWPHPQRSAYLLQWLDDQNSPACCDALAGAVRAGIAVEPSRLAGLAQSPSAEIRAAALTAAVAQGTAPPWLAEIVHDNDFRVRLRLAEQCPNYRTALQADPHPYVRAAALTPERVAVLLDDPDRETSWHVLARAAHLGKISLWRLEPEPVWEPTAAPAVAAGPLALALPTAALPRRLGRSGPTVSALGVSGHYGLPVEGFRRAVEAGVNLLFWEPNYVTLTEFAGRLAAAERRALHFIAGTFEADARRVTRDAERALRQLKVERLALFLMFWVQGWNRITPDVRAALERLQQAGKIVAYSLSTHNRALAVEAIEAGWDPVMVRHSAAHRGAEQAILSRAVALGTSIITFNNTCYGRLLQAHGDLAAPAAADCYRYSLAQHGVTVCLSAPATLEQLDENLAAVRDPALPAERVAQLLEQGRRMYDADRVFRRWVRGV